MSAVSPAVTLFDGRVLTMPAPVWLFLIICAISCLGALIFKPCRRKAAAVIGVVIFAVPLAACGGSSGGSQSSLTCGQYQKAGKSSQVAYVQSMDSKVAINPDNTTYWLNGIAAICHMDGTSQSSIQQLLVNLGYLEPGQ